MARNKITPVEIASLINFGKELDRRIGEHGVGLTELSRRTAGAVSTTYISDIVRAGRGDSKKYFRIQRQVVVSLAQALDWNAEEALRLAGYAAEPAKPQFPPTLNKSRFASMEEKYESLPQEQQAEMEQILKLVDEELERRSQRTRHTK